MTTSIIIPCYNEKNAIRETVECIWSIIQKSETKNIEIIAVGIGHDVTRYYKKAIKIADVQELGDVMIEQLGGLFDNKKKLH